MFFLQSRSWIFSSSRIVQNCRFRTTFHVRKSTNCLTSELHTKSDIMANDLKQNTSLFKPYVICGPSGSGKTTLLSMLTSHWKDTFQFCISHTTRKPRVNEKEGISYYFIDTARFQQMISNNEFVEYAQFSDNYYGTSLLELESVKRSSRIPMLDVDIRGVISLKKINFDARYIFITTATMETLERNLRKRGSENDDTLNRRLRHAIEDIKTAENLTFDLVIVNEDLEAAFQKFKNFVQNDINKLHKATNKI